MTNSAAETSNPKITTVVIPATSADISGDIPKIKDLIQDSVFYLETITKCRYYPVPTIIVDEIPLKDRENYNEEEENNEGRENRESDRECEIHLLGVYFHPRHTPTPDLIKKLGNFGYNDAFIKSLSTNGVVVIGYNQCRTYADRENQGNAPDLFWDIMKAVLIHEHAHAITVEGINSKDVQLQYPIGKFYRTLADKIVCESIAEWLSMNYYRNNTIVFKILNEDALNNKKSLYAWPYGGAIYLEEAYEKDTEILMKTFDSFRENPENAIPLYLSDAKEIIIRLFCAYKNEKDFEKLRNQALVNKNSLIEALKFVRNAYFIEKLINGDPNLMDIVKEKDSGVYTVLQDFKRLQSDYNYSRDTETEEV